MEHLDSDFYSDRKYCDHCDNYVSYLMSLETSYCIECGGEVHLFSKEDWQSFNQGLSDRRPKGGRPRKNKQQQQKAQQQQQAGDKKESA
jgi:hypothetical protein